MASREGINRGQGGSSIIPRPASRTTLTRSRAADAASHLFFAYLRSCSPDSIRGTNGISALPISLQTLAQATEYPPPSPTRSPTAKVVMMVDSVSPTPFALLRRARHFEYRADDQALQEFSNYEDPIQALTDECQRVLKSISSTNQSAATISKDSPGLPDASWARFEDIGFRGFGDYSDEDDEKDGFVMMKKRKDPPGLRSTPLSKGHDLGRPTTPSWADFLSSGFVDDAGDGGPAPLLLPHDKVLPPLGGDRGQSAQSHRRKVDDAALVPGELASITTIDFDDAFWWVWISSLAGEETTERKAVFGRCALIETNIRGGRWLILEEIVQGAAPEPEEGAYIAEKKSRFGFSTRGRFARTKSGSKKPPPPAKADPYARNHPAAAPASKVSIGPDQHARIQAAAAALQQKNKAHGHEPTSPRRARTDDAMDTKTNSVFTLQPVIMNEAAPAMKWANSYDKEATRATYLGNNFAGRGSTGDLRGYGANGYLSRANENAIPVPTDPSSQFKSGLTHQGLQRDDSARSGSDSAPDRDLPALPSNSKEPVPAPSQLPPSTRLVVSNGAAAAATQAAEVPLPTPTPMEGPHPLASPPVLPPKQTFDDFDEGLLNGSSPAAPEHSNGVSSQPSSPEGKGGAKKLSKPQQPGGLKGFFGGKKRPGAPTLPAPQAPADSSAVAAARAAYVGPAMKPNYGSSSSHLSRRFSTVGRKRVVPMPSGAPVRASPAEERGTQEIQAPIPITAKRFEPTNNPFGMSRSSLHVNALEPREGDGGFHRFDQGPMLDQPAFVPADSPEPPQPPSPSQQPSPPRQPSPPSATTAPPPLENHPANRTASPGEPVQPPPDSRPVIASRVEVVDASESEEESSESPPLDRWAQIRKNAAERAARQNEAKQNPGVYVEERSRPSNVTRTDDDDADGETSGEESEFVPVRARVDCEQGEPKHVDGFL